MTGTTGREGTPVVGWVEDAQLALLVKAQVRALRIYGALTVVAAAICVWIVFADIGMVAIFAAGWMVASYLWLLSMTYRRWKLAHQAHDEHWGSLHARVEADRIELGNPFTLLMGRGLKVQPGDPIEIIPTVAGGRGGVRTDWKLQAGKRSTVFPARGAWTPEQWSELRQGLARLGLRSTPDQVPPHRS